ncbi:PadR family transcriptional regulator [Rhodococcus sp. BP-316]|uniref:PadR family transcriptional regulator n=1 Tax=Rhodococcus sp. BP-316 TaxID=2739445 RepID=UPI001C9AB394|nr:PadR family transcriptional regulator [Rhodococcus sp. BP-316]MBY6682710.1 PadR family transcriptional regulator [Rhodococcus sp. BP-316]
MERVTPLAIAVLACLFERPMHPYEMYQLLLERKDDRLLKVRPGSLYHAVDRLAERELIVAVGTEREGNRPERTTYSVTDSGRAALSDTLRTLLAEPTPEYSQFTLALSESHNLPGPEVATLVRTRIALLEKDLDEMRVIDAMAVDRHVPRLFSVGLDYTLALREAELTWLRAFVDDIDSGRLPWLDRILTERQDHR